MSSSRARAIPEEARSYQGDRAGIVTRLLANIVDLVLVIAAVILSYGGWAALRFLTDPTSFHLSQPSFLGALLMGWAYLFAYFAFSWATTGRTYGDHLMGLRVVNFRGERVHWVGSIVRAAFCTFIMIGLFWVIISRENRSIQDMVLRTSVIHDWETKTVRI